MKTATAWMLWPRWVQWTAITIFAAHLRQRSGRSSSAAQSGRPRAVVDWYSTAAFFFYASVFLAAIPKPRLNAKTTIRAERVLQSPVSIAAALPIEVDNCIFDQYRYRAVMGRRDPYRDRPHLIGDERIDKVSADWRIWVTCPRCGHSGHINYLGKFATLKGMIWTDTPQECARI